MLTSLHDNIYFVCLGEAECYRPPNRITVAPIISACAELKKATVGCELTFKLTTFPDAAQWQEQWQGFRSIKPNSAWILILELGTCFLRGENSKAALLA